MTAAEKIDYFTSIAELLKELQKDRQSTAVLRRRYAVRFIMLDNFNLFQELIKEMTKADIQIYNLEQLLDPNDKDGWITTDMLVDAIRNLSGCCCFSIFEIVRFYKDDKFKALFEGMSLMELQILLPGLFPLIG